MKKILTICIVLILSGCVTRTYRGQPITDKEKWHNDVHECVEMAYKDRDNTGAVVGGVLLGPLGSIAGHAVQDGNSERPSVAKEISACLKQKGYGEQKD